MNSLQVGATGFVLLSGLVGAVLAFEARYENEDAAAAVHELLAAENETDRLDTRLELLKIRIDKFVELARVRPLTEAEQIELRAIERERDAILQRMATKG